MRYLLVCWMLLAMSVSVWGQGKKLKFYKVDAAIGWDDKMMYIFSGRYYFAYSYDKDKVLPGYPKLIKGNWPLWEDGVDAALAYANGYGYFFKGKYYTKINVKTRKAVSGYPKLISSGWPGVWADGIEAATLWDNNIAYFFKGHMCAKFNIKKDKVVSRGTVSQVFPGFWREGIDAMVRWSEVKCFVFKGMYSGRFLKKEKYLDYIKLMNTVWRGFPFFHPSPKKAISVYEKVASLRQQNTILKRDRNALQKENASLQKWKIHYSKAYSGYYKSTKVHFDIKTTGKTYTGTLVYLGKKFPFTAVLKNGWLEGKFTVGDKDFAFSASSSGKQMMFRTGTFMDILDKQK